MPGGKLFQEICAWAYKAAQHYGFIMIMVCFCMIIRVGLLVKLDKLTKWQLLVDTVLAFFLGFGMFLALEHIQWPAHSNFVISCLTTLIGQNLLDFFMSNDKRLFNKAFSILVDRFKKK